MRPERVHEAVDLVTGQREPTAEERERLRAGDARLMAVVRTGHTLRGTPITDNWPGREPPDGEPHTGLTGLQRELARLMLLDGLDIRQAAERMGISFDAAKGHAVALRKKTGERNTWRAALLAGAWGWL